jgi:hypothetical protein
MKIDRSACERPPSGTAATEVRPFRNHRTIEVLYGVQIRVARAFPAAASTSSSTRLSRLTKMIGEDPKPRRWRDSPPMSTVPSVTVCVVRA